MGTKRFYRVFCDVCETVHIHTRSSITTASAARAAAKEDGWQHISRKGKDLILCPTCGNERMIDGRQPQPESGRRAAVGSRCLRRAAGGAGLEEARGLRRQGPEVAANL